MPSRERVSNSGLKYGDLISIVKCFKIGFYYCLSFGGEYCLDCLAKIVGRKYLDEWSGHSKKHHVGTFGIAGLLCNSLYIILFDTGECGEFLLYCLDAGIVGDIEERC